jgi:predicted glycoside hydrolase/deacetylase ChbG (UPF0249 family)
VNADDLGYDPEIDRGILEAHARGLVTSASVMVGTAHAAAAVAAAPPGLGLGLHVVLPAELAPGQVEAEVLAQLERFGALAGRGPTHLDSHKHAHARPELAAAFAHAAARIGLPVRAIDASQRDLLRAAGVRTTDAFLGDAALRPCWTRERLVAALGALGPGTSELMCHPGYRPSAARTSFAAEREVELAALCDPAARAALDAGGVVLVGWGAL